ncbi:phospholipid:diacylglycerol acyltransferase 1-like protein [Tanacetum coccineum]
MHNILTSHSEIVDIEKVVVLATTYLSRQRNWIGPFGIKVRPVSGLVVADYFAPGYFVWAVLIANFARVGYEEKNMYMAVRGRTLSRLKRNIEMMVEINGGENAVIIPHSMGVLYFLHFMKWVEAPASMGGGGGSDWGIAPDLLEFVASKMMERRNVHYSHGLADDLNDPKYQHYKYWSNALETKLPNAPDMEIYSMYSVGIATERAYVYKLTPQTECYIPFQIDNTAGDTNSHVCLKDGVYTIDIHKSNIYGIGVNKDEVLSMASNAGCIAGDIPFNYLGLPIGSNMKSIAS